MPLRYEVRELPGATNTVYGIFDTDLKIFIPDGSHRYPWYTTSGHTAASKAHEINTPKEA